MLTLMALREAVACYRAAIDATEDHARIATAERAQNFGIVAAVSVLFSVVWCVALVLTLRCLGEALGAFDASSVADLSGWVQAQYREDGMSAAFYGSAWAFVAWGAARLNTTICGTLYDGLGGTR